MEVTFRSTKVLDGFSTVFRQWKARGTHCKFLHGYAISFKVIFEGELDERNWVVDFGGLKRSHHTIDGKKPKEWFDYMFDHTLIAAEDDPDLPSLLELNDMEMAQVRVLPKVGCEMFAKFVYEKLQEWVHKETEGRVFCHSVECREHEKNSAIYKCVKK